MLPLSLSVTTRSRPRGIHTISREEVDLHKGEEGGSGKALSSGSCRPTKRTVQIEEPSDRSRLAEEAARLQAKVVKLEQKAEALTAEQQKKATE